MTSPGAAVSGISSAIDEASRMSFGPAHIAATEQLVDRADTTGDVPLIVRALQEYVSALNFGGERDRAPVPFARVLALWDQDPGKFDDRARHALFWHFKWVTSGLVRYPDVPLPVIRRWLDEMETRYRSQGHGMYAVLDARQSLAWHLGDRDEARRLSAELAVTPRDEMSNCHACCAQGDGSFLAWLGDDRAALEAWAPVLDGSLACAEEPERTLARSLLTLLRLGRPDLAREHHLRGYPPVRRQPALASSVARHVEFAALTGNEPLALELLDEHAEWIDPGFGDVDSRLAFFGGVAVLLRRLEDLGHGDLPVRTPRLAEPVTPVRELRPELERLAGEIAARFDARNGTAEVGGALRSRLAAEPFGAVPIGRRSTPLPAPVPSPGDAPADDAVAEAAAPADPHELLRRAFEQAEAGAEVRAVVDLALAAAAGLDAVDPPAAGQARLLAVSGLLQNGSAAAADALLIDAQHDLGDDPDEQVRLDLAMMSGRTAQQLGRAGDAVEAFIRAAELAERLGRPHARASALDDAAQLLAEDGQLDEALPMIRQAIELVAGFGDVPDLVRLGRAEAWMLLDTDPPDAALPRMRQALATAEAFEDDEVAPFVLAETRRQLAGLVCALPRPVPEDVAAEAQRAADAAAATATEFEQHGGAASAQLLGARIAWELRRDAADAEARIERMRQEAVRRGDADTAETCDRYRAFMAQAEQD